MRLSDRLIKDPLWLFIIAGAIIFGANQLLRPSDTLVVIVDPATQARLLEEQSLLVGHELSEEESSRIIDEYADREILFLEALRQGMHQYDPRVREALIERVRQGMISNISEPDEGELIDFYSSNLDLYKTEPEISFDQFLLAEASTKLSDVLSFLTTNPEAPQIGLSRRREFEKYGLSVLRALYNEQQLTSLLSAKPATWTALPDGVAGKLLVRVRAHHPPRLIPYPEIRDQVRVDVASRREQEAINQAMQTLRRKYDVRIEAQN